MMKEKLISGFRQHLGAFIYVVILCGLNIGVVMYSGFRHLDKMAIVVSSFILFYFLLAKFIKTSPRIPKDSEIADRNLNLILLLSTSLVIFILDLIFLKGLPGFHLFNTQTVSEVTSLRNDIHINSPKVIVYLSGFNLRGLFPFILLYLYHKKKSLLLTIFSILGAIYAFGMLQKSFIVFMLLPVLLYSLLRAKYWMTLLQTSIIVAVISTIIVGSADKVDDSLQEIIVEEPIDDPQPMALRIIVGMSTRIFVTPGEMVSKWFDLIPDTKPYLYGDGYPILPRLKGSEYVDYNTELYPIIRPQYAERGLTGTVNCATFMREFSNFGYLGLILSSFFVSIFLFLLHVLFREHVKLFLSINVVYLLMLSSTNLWTLMFSGGWLLLILLYYLFRSDFNQQKLSSIN